jgi:hypothetical protein
VGTQVLDPLRACVKVVDCCDSFFVGTPTYVKSLVTYIESIFATVSEQFAIEDCCLLFLVRMIRPSCIASSHLIN